MHLRDSHDEEPRPQPLPDLCGVTRAAALHAHCEVRIQPSQVNRAIRFLLS